MTSEQVLPFKDTEWSGLTHQLYPRHTLRWVTILTPMLNFSSPAATYSLWESKQNRWLRSD